MGKVTEVLFGGSHGKSQSSSGNQAYPYLQQSLGGTIGRGDQAGSTLANLLGLNGPNGSAEGFANFRNSTGYQFGKDQGIQGIVGNQATKGLLNSGGTLKAIDTFGQNYADSKYGDYTNLLQGLLGSGIQGAGVLGDAGKVSQSTSSESSQKGGLGQAIGTLLAK